LKPSTIALAAGFSCLTAGPALAQTNQKSATAPATSDSANASSNMSANASANNSATEPTGAHAPAGTLVKAHGEWRASEIVGATVYNSDGKSIGTINDLLLSSKGTVSNAIISVGGFLGIGQKLVKVPFNQIKFVPSASNPASGSHVSAQTGEAPAAGPGAPGTIAPHPAAGAPTPPGVAPATTPGASGTASGTAPGRAPVPAPTGAAHRPAEYSATLPGATQKSLKSDPGFSFNK
jgi:sporulation protein YlmC with PRC-barrel domain